MELKYGLTIRLNTRDVELPLDPEGTSTNDIDAKNCVIEALQHHPLKHKTRVFEEDELSEYQAEHSKEGIVIHVMSGQDATVHLNRVIAGNCVYHILVIVEDNATLTLIDEYTGTPTLHSAAVEIIAYENAKVTYATLQQLESGHDFVNYRARLHKNAQLDWFIAQYGATISRAVVDTELAGEHSAVRSYGVYLGNNTQQFDRSDAVMHRANHSSSDMHTKGVLRGSAKAIFRGTIDIDAQAYTCDGYQKNHTLLLSPDAVADAIPNLEIRNNDVKCSHGATIGRIDEEHLFYLTSRGIPEDEAVRILVEGFFTDLAATLENDELTEKITLASSEALQ